MKKFTSEQTVIRPFSDERICEKCKSTGVRFHYHACAFHEFPGSDFPCTHWDIRDTIGEHLCKQCNTCRYSWIEETADHG